MKLISVVVVTLTAVVLAIGIGLTACGSSHTTASALSTPQVRQAETAARQVATACLNKGGGLKAMFRCAVPPHHGRAFLLCVLRGVPKNVSNTAAIEEDLVKCGEKYR